MSRHVSISPTEAADRVAIRELMLAALRYHDTCVKINGAWFFAERLLYVDWQEERALS